MPSYLHESLNTAFHWPHASSMLVGLVTYRFDPYELVKQCLYSTNTEYNVNSILLLLYVFCRILMLPVHWIPQRGHSDSVHSQQSTGSDSDSAYHDAVEEQPPSDAPPAAAPPTSPTSSGHMTISSPDEVMEQLLHHHLEEIEMKQRELEASEEREREITGMESLGYSIHRIGGSEGERRVDIIPSGGHVGKEEEGERGTERNDTGEKGDLRPEDSDLEQEKRDLVRESGDVEAKSESVLGESEPERETRESGPTTGDQNEEKSETRLDKSEVGEEKHGLGEGQSGFDSDLGRGEEDATNGSLTVASKGSEATSSVEGM